MIPTALLTLTNGNAPVVFEELVRDEPDDPDLHFWRGYLLRVALAGHDELGLAELRRAFDLDSSHPYANLVLEGYEGPRKPFRFFNAPYPLSRTTTKRFGTWRAASPRSAGMLKPARRPL